MLRLSVESVFLIPIVMFQVLRQFRKGRFHHADEVVAAGCRGTESNHGLAFRHVIGHHQHFTIGLKPGGGALNQIIRRLTARGKQHFHFRGGMQLGSDPTRQGAIEEQGDRCAGGIAVMCELFNQSFPSGSGMTLPSGRKFRPGVQQAVSVHKDSYQRHSGKLGMVSALGKFRNREGNLLFSAFD
jgi:hypothetical protein